MKRKISITCIMTLGISKCVPTLKIFSTCTFKKINMTRYDEETEETKPSVKFLFDFEWIG